MTVAELKARIEQLLETGDLRLDTLVLLEKNGRSMVAPILEVVRDGAGRPAIAIIMEDPED